jgi:hypothetical protein
MKFIGNQNSNESESGSRSPGLWSFLPSWSGRGRNWSGFWSLGAALSLILNVILLIIVIILGWRFFTWKKAITDNFVGGLYYNFILMDQATIQADVEVEDTIPVQFNLPLKKETNVRLTEATQINGARVTVRTGGLNIANAPADIILPEGTILPVELDMVVPVDTTIPVTISVPVNIPMSETELHDPFVGLQNVVSPIYWWLYNLPNSWWEFITGK